MIVFQSLMLFIVWYCSFYLFFFFSLRWSYITVAEWTIWEADETFHPAGVPSITNWICTRTYLKKKKTFVLNVALRSAKDDGLLSGCLLPSLSPSLLLSLSPPLSRSCLLFIFLQIKTVKISLLFKWATCVSTNEDVLCLNRCDLNNSITCGEF